jgi:hypothetical protein
LPLTLSGSITSVTDAQRAAIASSLAASLSVSAAQVQIALAPSAHRRRSLLLQGVQLRVTVTSLGSDAAPVKQAGALLTAPATLSAMVARVASPEVTAASATPASVTSVLEVKVSVPATMSPAAVTATFSSGNAASLGSQLQAAGITVSGVVIHSGAPAGVQPPAPAAAAAPEAVKGNNTITIAISISVAFVLLVCGASCYWSRRARGALKVVARKWVGKTFVKDEEEYDDACEPTPFPPQYTRARMPALQIPSADGVVRSATVINQQSSGGGRSMNSVAGHLLTPISEGEAPVSQLQLLAASMPPGRAMPRLPALMVPSAHAGSSRRDTILDNIGASAPQHAAPPYNAAATSPRTNTTPILRTLLPITVGAAAGGSRNVALNLSGVAEEAQEEEEQEKSMLFASDYLGSP